MNFIQQLNHEDFQIVKKLFQFDNFLELGFKNFYLEGDTHKSFGFYENGKLTELISFNESLDIPAWSVSHSFSKSELHFQEMISYIANCQEKKFLYQFFILNDSKDFKLSNNRYQIYLEHVVPSDNLTGFENIDHDLLEYKKFDKTMYVHLCVLKNEYRSF